MADREYTLRDIDDYDSQYVWIDWFTTEELPALARIDCTWTWHDQGWGNLKGAIRAVLVREGQEIADLQIGPIAAHEKRDEHFCTSEGELFQRSQSGDIIKFQYTVGGGGGHTLHIKNFKAKLLPRVSTKRAAH